MHFFPSSIISKGPGHIGSLLSVLKFFYRYILLSLIHRFFSFFNFISHLTFAPFSSLMNTHKVFFRELCSVMLSLTHPPCLISFTHFPRQIIHISPGFFFTLSTVPLHAGLFLRWWCVYFLFFSEFFEFLLNTLSSLIKE